MDALLQNPDTLRDQFFETMIYQPAGYPVFLSGWTWAGRYCISPAGHRGKWPDYPTLYFRV